MRTDYRPQTIAQRPCHCFVVSLLAMTLVITTVFITTVHADINDGLVGQWGFEEAEGTTASGAPLVNGPKWSPGVIGKTAISLDGVDDYIALGTVVKNSSLDMTNKSFSMTAWVKWNGAKYSGKIFSFADPQSHFTGLVSSNASNLGRFAFVIYTGSRGNVSASCAHNPTANTWYHLAGTWDGVNARIYMNGTLCTTSTDSFSDYDFTNDWFNIGVGRLNAAGEVWSGDIDDVRLYQRALAPHEIQDLCLLAGSVCKEIVSTNPNSGGSSNSSSGNASEPLPEAVGLVERILFNWETPTEVFDQIEYGITPSYGDTLAWSATASKSHARSAKALQPDTLYHYRILTKDANGVINVSEDRTVKTMPMPPRPVVMDCSSCKWQPPVGVPRPSFGVEESVQMYASKVDGINYKTDSKGNIYTHYIDSAAPCPGKGTETEPLCKLPLIWEAGSVMLLAPGVYSNAKNDVFLSKGLVDRPVFIRSLDPVNPAQIIGYVDPTDPNDSRGMAVRGSYVIIENLKFTKHGHFSVRENSKHISFRHNEVTAMEGGSMVGLWAGTQWKPGELIEDIVFYNNQIHDNGARDARGQMIWPPTFESGVHGIGLSNSQVRVWVIDNEIYRNTEDGLQVFGGGRGDYIRYLYIARNKMYQNGENAIDIKQASDVVISSNQLYQYRPTHFPSSGSDGAAIVFNDDAPSDRLWLINNEIFDSTVGIRTQASGNNYIIGNVFHDILQEEGKGGYAIWASSAQSVHIVSNTLVNVASGITVSNGHTYEIKNNLIANLFNDSFYHLNLNVTTTTNYQLGKNLLYDKEAGPRVRYSRTYTDYINANPNLDERYMLQSASPAIDQGTSSDVYETFFQLYGIDLNKDMRGIKRPYAGGWDIGAYEYASPENRVVLGDVSGEGKITMYDAALALRYTLGFTLSDSQKQQADMNSDGKIDGIDVMMIAKRALGL